MKKYFLLIFPFYSGLEPIGFLSGGIISYSSLDYSLSVIIGIFIPIFAFGLKNIKDHYLRKPIYIILGIVAARFVLDAFVQTTIDHGPWRIFLLVGISYAMYFVLCENINKDNFFSVILYFIFIATCVSLISILQILFPFLPIFGGSRPFEMVITVGEGFIRLQNTFYHCSVLAIMLILGLLITQRIKIFYRILLVLACLSNFATIMLAGYRATMYVFLATLFLSFLFSFRRISLKAKLFVFAMLIPFVVYIVNYSLVRTLQTTSNEGVETSLVYRYVETGLGFEKLAETNNWIFGIGYSDGFINPFSDVIIKETYYLHNGYASIIYNYGIVGGIAWFIFIVAILLFLFNHYSEIKSNPIYIFITFYIIGQLVANYSSGIFNRERNATFCFLFAFSLLEKGIRSLRTNDNSQYSKKISLHEK